MIKETVVLWEMYQQRRISQANTKAIRADSRASQLEGELELMNDRIAVLALACQSLWELLQDHTGITAAELDKKMEEIDLRDGVRDGKMTATTDTCSKCGRKTSRRRKNCIYCGNQTGKGEVFGRR